MCYDVPPILARFIWLLVLIIACIGFYSGAYILASSYGMGKDFGLFFHACPLLLLVVGHWALMGLRPEELDEIDPDNNITTLMKRILLVTIICTIALLAGIAISIAVWWSDPMPPDVFIYGPRPKHASPSAPPHSDTSLTGLIPNPLKSPTRTPSETPTSSPNPSIRAEQFQRLTDHRSTVGGVYMMSVLSGIGTVIANYFLHVVR